MLNVFSGKINLSILGLIFFLLAYPFFLIIVGFNISEKFNFIYYAFLNIFCIITSFILLIKFRNLFSYILYILMGVSFLLSFFSYYYNYLDALFFIKALGYFSAGYIFFKFMQNSENISLRFHIFLFLLCLFSATLFDYSEGNYLYYSDSLVIYSFFILALLGNKNRFSFLSALLVFILTSTCLYFINSRSAILFFVASFVAYFFTVHGLKKSLLIMPPIFLSVFSFIFYINSTLDNYDGHRLLRLIFDRDTDTSLGAREVVNQFGKDTFYNNWFTGDFGLYRGIFGDGLYAHNYYSFLAEFGIIGVLMIFYILIVYFFGFLRVFYFNVNMKKSEILLLLCLVYSTLGLVFSKSYVWLLLYFCLGLAVASFRISKSSKLRFRDD